MNQDKAKSVDKKILGESEYPFHHSLPLQIRFNDIDTLGHVNNTVYFSFFDLGKAKYFLAVRGEIDWGNANVVIANINCNFLAPIFFNEKIEVQTQVQHVGKSSFKLFQRLLNSDTQEVKCCCTTIMVGFDIAKQCSTPLEQDWIDSLNKFEQRDLCVK